MTNIFKNPDLASYTRERPKILRAYVENMCAFLKRKYPDASEDEITSFLEKYVQENVHRPVADVLTHPQYGRTVRKNVDLLTHTMNMEDNIITPAGVVYMLPSKKRSILSETLEESVKLRTKFKHVQLEAAAQGDSVREVIAKLLQSSAKIFNNSIPGAMGTKYSFLYDLPGYNAITGGARQCVMTGYAQTERMIGANLYVTSVDDVINYCNILLKNFPKQNVIDVMVKYGLVYPSEDILVEYFMDFIKYYRPMDGVKEGLHSFISTMTDAERAYVLYAYGFKSLLLHNDVAMRALLKEFFRRDVNVDPAWDPSEIFKIEDDLMAMAMQLNFDVINREPKLDEAVKNNPDGVRVLLGICYHMMNCLEKWSDLMTTFFVVDMDMPKTWFHPNMVRRCVIVSDTDSVIFSTNAIVEWYSPDHSFSQDAYDINALSVFMVSQTLEHLFARLSAGFGMETPDRGRIKMKNEFYYPILVRSSMAKHYAGAISIQEGKILPKPKMDIKGINFRGSDLPSETTTSFNAFAKWAIDELGKSSTIDGSELATRVAGHEARIYQSLMKGEKLFLPTKSVRRGTEYKDPIVSDFFYCMLWQEVFAEAWGEFVLPNKGYVMPIIGGGAAINDPVWLDRLKKSDIKIYNKLQAFKELYPKKNITRIIIPPTLSEVPEILRPILDVRRIIFSNGRPFYLFLRSFGIAVNDVDGKFLMSDFIDAGGPEVSL